MVAVELNPDLRLTSRSALSERPFPASFFAQALSSQSLAHGYVLSGQDYERMYITILDIAKALNCQASPAPDAYCDACQNCLWIANNAHPAVITVSRYTYLVSDTGKDLSEDELAKLSKKPAQTQIKTEQIGRLIHQLSVSSPYYRVIIFTDADEGPSSQDEGITPPYDWQSRHGQNSNQKIGKTALENQKTTGKNPDTPKNTDKAKAFLLRPLHRSLFNAESANRFLKTLEEPPKNTIFFFLTDSQENLLETIVSRCQTVAFPGKPQRDEWGQYSEQAQEVYRHWLARFQFPKVNDPGDLIGELQEVLVSQDGLSIEQALYGFQLFLRREYQATEQLVLPFEDYHRLQQAFEQAKSMLHAKTNPDQVIFQLFLKLTSSSTPAFSQV